MLCGEGLLFRSVGYVTTYVCAIMAQKNDKMLVMLGRVEDRARRREECRVVMEKVREVEGQVVEIAGSVQRAMVEVASQRAWVAEEERKLKEEEEEEEVRRLAEAEAEAKAKAEEEEVAERER